MLVAKLVNTFTNPDTIYIQQMDPPEHNINMTANKEEEGYDGATYKIEPFMYFIRAGRYTVHVNSTFITKRTQVLSVTGEEA